MMVVTETEVDETKVAAVDTREPEEGVAIEAAETTTRRKPHKRLSGRNQPL